jgi:hypothetical protein
MDIPSAELTGGNNLSLIGTSIVKTRFICFISLSIHYVFYPQAPY